MTINIIVADDSAYLRKNIADILRENELIEIVEFAKNGEETVKFVKKYSPDVLVLDLVMPKMNGLEAFKRIMADHPTPTVILSAISPKNLDSSIQALLMGAFDYIIKPGGLGAKDLPRFREELLAKVLLASQSQIKRIFEKDEKLLKTSISIRQDLIDEIFKFGQYLNRLQPIQEIEDKPEYDFIINAKVKEILKEEIKTEELSENDTTKIEITQKKPVRTTTILETNKRKKCKSPINNLLQGKTPSIQYKKTEPVYVPKLSPIKGVVLTSNIIVIGASVGGPRTITTILKEIPKNFRAPILIVQHLSSHFTDAFADNLDLECNLKSKVATNGEYLQNGVVYIAPGEKHIKISVENKNPCIKLYKGAPVNFCIPSIDILFFSAARIYRNRAMGILLTGMGSDGVEGLRAIQKVGGKTIAESEETCILYAMPKFAAEKGFADQVLPNYDIKDSIIKFGDNIK